MDSVALWFDEEDFPEERVQRRIIRDKSNLLGLSNKRFIENYRLSKDAFMYVLNSIGGDLKERSRSTSIPATIKLGATLKFLAKGGYQSEIGKDEFTGMAQQTVSNVIFEVCAAIESRLCAKHIKFNTTDAEKAETKKHFFLKSGIPGIIGVVAGTHIHMVKPKKNEFMFYNPSMKFSVNAMLICDQKMTIRSVNGKYGGESLDSEVWDLSNEMIYLRNKFNEGHKSEWLIADSGYALEPWMMVPYRHAPKNSKEALFNDKLSSARSVIDRMLDLLKSRFRCLDAAKELHYAPEKVVQILNVCCALHNICLMYNVESPELIPRKELDCIMHDEDYDQYNDYLEIAKPIRDNIKNNLKP